ncbi:MAG: hypothetical protein WC637_04855 [Victivallales bacterium]|jgi:hypothetical protein
MGLNMLKKTAVCLLAGAFLAGSVYAEGAKASKTNKPTKSTAKKADPFAVDNTKKDKVTLLGASGLNGRIAVTQPADASGKLTASFTNGKDSKQYNILIDDASKKMLSNIKTGSNVQVKGSIVVKPDGATFLKVDSCTVFPEPPQTPAS